MTTPERTIGRLSLYRRLLYEELRKGRTHIHSHEVASLAGGSAAQVRRDIMTIGYSGSPNRGYDVRTLIESIGNVLDEPEGQNIVLVGVGNLGRAILAFFSTRRLKLSIVAAFDTDPAKTGRLVSGRPCYPLQELPRIVAEHNVRVGIIAVPEDAARQAANALVDAGVRGILNFAPVALRVPPGIYVEQNDITMSLEKVVYFAGQSEKSVEKEKNVDL